MANSRPRGHNTFVRADPSVLRPPGQRSYELIRPVVLIGQSLAARAAETGAAERTLHRQVARFDQRGLAGLVPPNKVEQHRVLPPEVRQAMLDARREHPPLNTHELTTICWARTETVLKTGAVRRRCCTACGANSSILRNCIRSSTARGPVGCWTGPATPGSGGGASTRSGACIASRLRSGCWLYAEHLTLVYRDEPLAQYRVTYQPDQRRLQTVTPAQLFETPCRSPQRPLWTEGDDNWLPVLRLPAYSPRQPKPTGAAQPPLFTLEEVGT